MHGQESILQMRTSGRQPILVYLNDNPCSTEWNETDVNPTICIAGDDLQHLDLRFLFGLSIVAITSSEKRLLELSSYLPSLFPKDFVLYLLRTETDWGKKPTILINWNIKDGHH